MQANAARNRALLIGTVWSLAAAVALAWFKSALSEPIYLWTLGVVACGWAGIVLYASAAAQRAQSATIAGAWDEVRTMLDRLAQSSRAQLQQACGELARADALLEHAIAQLMAVFDRLNDQACRQQNELALAAAKVQGTPAAERLRAEAGRVASDVNAAVMALQFRDVVGQKLGHVRRELEALERLMQRIGVASGAQSEPAAARGPGQADLAARVQSLLRELEEARAVSPVQQQLMHAGEIDLF